MILLSLDAVNIILLDIQYILDIKSLCISYLYNKLNLF